MRILYLADFPLPMPYARAIQTLQTCWALAERGCEVTLLAARGQDRRPASDWLRDYGLVPHPCVRLQQVPVLTLPGRPYHPRWGSYELQALSAVRQVIRHRHADTIYVRTPRLARLLVITGLARRMPVIHEVHRPHTVTARYAQQVLRRVRGLVALSAAAVQQLRAHVSDAVPMLLARDGAVAVAVREVPPAARCAPARVLYCGQFHADKGVELLLRAMTRLTDVHLLLIGGLADADGRRRLAALQALIASWGLESRVQCLGYVPPATVPRHLAAADLVVLPYPDTAGNRHALSPLKLFEAMAVGRPIVATNLPSLCEVLRHDDNAWLVPPDDAEALASGIRRVLDDPALAQRIAASARRDAANYTWDRRAAQLMGFFDQVVGRS